jgi:hypothetical protein
MLTAEEAINGLKEENYKGLMHVIGICDRIPGSDIISSMRLDGLKDWNQYLKHVGEAAIERQPEYRSLLGEIESSCVDRNFALKAVGFAYQKEEQELSAKA